MKKKILIFVLLPVFALALTGCKSIQEKAAEKAWERGAGNSMDIDIKEGGEQMTFKDKETGDKVSVGQNKVPSDWPKDVPLYKGEIVMSMQIGEGMSLNIKSDDDSTEIKEWYKKELIKLDWVEGSVIEAKEVWRGSFTKDGDVFSVTISSSEDDDGSIISLTYSKKTQ